MEFKTWKKGRKYTKEYKITIGTKLTQIYFSKKMDEFFKDDLIMFQYNDEVVRFVRVRHSENNNYDTYQMNKSRNIFCKSFIKELSLSGTYFPYEVDKDSLEFKR